MRLLLPIRLLCWYVCYTCSCLLQGYHHVDDAYHMTDLHSNDSDDEVIHHDEKKPEVGGASAAGDNKEHHEDRVGGRAREEKQ